MTGWRDPSPHKTTLVTVEDDVRLEVLDWGGTGPALVLLAGLSDAAHVFDEVAPKLAMRYRVVGVTRRGHPGSSERRASRQMVRRVAERGRVSELSGGHDLIVSNPREVLAEIEAFVKALPGHR